MKNAFQLLGAEGATLTFALLAVFPTCTVFSQKIGVRINTIFIKKLNNFSKKISIYFFQFLGLGTLVAVSIFLRPTHTNNSSNFKSQMFLEVFCVEVVAPFTLLFEVR